MKEMRKLFLLLISFFMISCSKVSDKISLPPTLERFKSEIPAKKEEKIEEEKKDRTIEKLTLPSPKIPEKKQPPKEEEPFQPDKIKLPDEKVVINADKMPLFEFLLYVFGDVLKVPFILDEGVRNLSIPITLQTPQPVTSKDALVIIVEMLKKYDINVSIKAGAIFITKPKPPPPEIAPKDVSIGDKVPLTSSKITHIIPLHYIKASDLITFITDTYKGTVTAKIFPKENSLALTGSGIQINNVINFIKTIDIPYFKDKKILVVKLLNWKPEDLIKQLSEILQGIGISIAKSPGDPGVYLIALKYLNSLLAIVPDETTYDLLSEWINRLDTPESIGTEEKIFTYIPQYVRASELVASIRNILTGQSNPPASQSPQFPTPFGVRNIPPRQPTQPTPPDSQLLQPFGQAQTQPSTQTFSTESLKISSDDKRNIIIVITTPSIYKMVLELFKTLDKPPRQVLIETVIAEVTLKDDLKYGVEWYIKNKFAEGVYTIQTLGQLGVSTTGGLIYQFVSDSEKFKALINLFAQKNLINILSTPRILVLDNEEATINIGMEVPIVTGEQTTTGITAGGEVGIVRTYQYRTTGITLKVKPTINTEGLLTLNISQEVSQAQPNKISAIESPLILTRKINTIITAPTDHTIVLGGLIEENKSKTETKVPLAGDIPLLGHLFKGTSESSTKTELIIMLTPKIFSSVDELVKTTEELKKEFQKIK